MADDVCFLSLKNLFPDLKPEVLKNMLRQLTDEKSKMYSGNLSPSNPEFMRRAMRILSEMKFQNLAERRAMQLNILTNQKNLEFLKQPAFKNDPVAAIQAELVGGHAGISEGGNRAIDRLAKSDAAKRIRNVITALQDRNVLEAMQKPEFERNVAQEIFQLEKNGKLGTTNDVKALEAAKIIHASDEGLLRDKQLAGSPVRKLEGRVSQTTHDPKRLKEVGYTEWAKIFLPLLDHDKTFGGMTSKARGEMVAKAYQDIVNGRLDPDLVNRVSEGPITQGSGTANVANRLAQSRTFHFKDGYSWADYNQKFGTKNLLESTISNIMNGSKAIALMKKLGTNPDVGFRSLKLMARSLHADNPEAIASLDANEKKLNQIYDTVKGVSDQAGKSLGAKTGSNLRTIEAVSKLGATYVRSVRDFAQAGNVLRLIDGKNSLGHAAGLVPDYFKALTDNALREKWLRRGGIATEDLIGHTLSQVGGETAGSGIMSNLSGAFSRVSLIGRHFDAVKAATANQVAMLLGDRAGTAHGDLTPGFRAVLERYGIKEGDWEKLRGATEVDERGNKIMTPEAVSNLSSDLFQNKERGKQDLEGKLLELLNDHADMATNTPGARQKAFGLRGTHADEELGIILRMMYQFKGPALMAMDTARRIALNDPEARPQSLGEAIRTGKGDLNGILQLAAGTAIMGYIGNTLVDLANGKTPQDPTDPKTLANAFVRGGAFGLPADFVLNQYHKSIAESTARGIAGPVLGDVWDGGMLLHKLADPKQKNKGYEAERYIENNIPMHNLFWTKLMMDQLLFNRIHETLKPGSTGRQEASTYKKPGLFSDHQDYLLNAARPTQYLGSDNQ